MQQLLELVMTLVRLCTAQTWDIMKWADLDLKRKEQAFTLPMAALKS